MKWLMEKVNQQSTVQQLAQDLVDFLTEDLSRIAALNDVNQMFYNNGYRTQRQKDVLIAARNILMEQI